MAFSLFFNFLNAVSLLLLGDPEPPAPVRNDNPPQLPIDSGIWILLIFGLILGIYFAVKKIKSSNSPA